jgi:sortase (surface protein transpeptidase)
MLIILGLSGALYSGQQLTAYKDLEPTARPVLAKAVQPAKSRLSAPLPRSEPTRLQINRVNIDAPIVPVGLDANGAIQVPGPTLTGWYDQGPTPGERGPAVIDGHVDYIRDIAVFWRLRELVPGDIITVSRADGEVVTFKVDSLQHFPQDSFPTQAVYGPLNYAGLRLITCGGTFNTATHHYSDNIVAFATMTGHSKP